MNGDARIVGSMSHADTLRVWGVQFARPDHAAAFEAGADALDTLDRVRAVLAGFRGQQEAALQCWDDTGDTWDGAVSDTLHDTIHLLTEALEGDTDE